MALDHWDAVVLMGPSGCGKSHLGHALDDAGLARFTDLEPLLLQRFGTGPNFAARKAEVLEWLAACYAELLAIAELPVVIQSTGLSDRDILLELARHYRLLHVRINTPLDVCVERVIARPTGGNLNSDPAYTAQFHNHWVAEVAPRWGFELTVDGTDTPAALARIAAALGLPPDSSRA